MICQEDQTGHLGDRHEEEKEDFINIQTTSNKWANQVHNIFTDNAQSSTMNLSNVTVRNGHTVKKGRLILYQIMGLRAIHTHK
jgi:hypothetical protein